MFELLTQIEFRHPAFLLFGLLALPVYFRSKRPAGRVIFSSLTTLPRAGASWKTRLAWLPAAILALSVLLLSIALAGPRIPDRSSRVTRDGIAIMGGIGVNQHQGTAKANLPTQSWGGPTRKPTFQHSPGAGPT